MNLKLLIRIALSFVFVAVFPAQVFAQNLIQPSVITGSGTMGDPYMLYDCDDLQDVSLELDAYYELANNIDCIASATWNSGEGFDPIGTFSDAFTGSFNGNGYSIANLFINRPASGYVGLFGYVSGGSNHSNVVLINADVTGNDNVGAYIGYAPDANVTQVSTSGSVTATNERAGGVIGSNANNGSATNLSSSATVLAGAYYAGGIIGSSDLDAEINNSFATGNVTGERYVGGLIGYFGGDADITNTYATGLITATESPAGGLIGESENTSTISDSYATGNVVVNTDSSDGTGGLIGVAYFSVIEDSYASGSITMLDSDASNTGGLLGYAEFVNVERSYSTGDVSGYDYVGGLIGYASDSDIVDSYATGDVVSNLGDNVGGLIGELTYSNLNTSFATGNVSGADDNVGGLIGEMYESYVYDTYARGNVDGIEDVGGLIGAIDYEEVYRSYSTGTVPTDISYHGGLIGYVSDGDTYFSFWDVESSGASTSDSDEVGKTTLQMKSIATYTTELGADSWDFEDVWSMDFNNDGYPYLNWFSFADADGIETSVEDAAPNSGDANNDGIADSEQYNVASYVNAVSSNYITLETTDTCGVTSVGSITEVDAGSNDIAFDYSSGLIDFELTCPLPGSTVNISIYMYGESSTDVFVRKINRVAETYTAIAEATMEDVVIGGESAVLIQYSITDGGDLDEDGEVNRVIVDPVGLASAVIGAPNTGFGGMSNL